MNARTTWRSGPGAAGQIVALALCAVAVAVCAAVATPAWLRQLTFFGSVSVESAEESRVVFWMVAGTLLAIAGVAWFLGRSKPAAVIVAGHAVLAFLHATLWLFTAGPVVLALLFIVANRLDQRAKGRRSQQVGVDHERSPDVAEGV